MGGKRVVDAVGGKLRRQQGVVRVTDDGEEVVHDVVPEIPDGGDGDGPHREVAVAVDEEGFDGHREVAPDQKVIEPQRRLSETVDTQLDVGRPQAEFDTAEKRHDVEPLGFPVESPRDEREADERSCDGAIGDEHPHLRRRDCELAGHQRRRCRNRLEPVVPEAEGRPDEVHEGDGPRQPKGGVFQPRGEGRDVPRERLSVGESAAEVPGDELLEPSSGVAYCHARRHGRGWQNPSGHWSD